MERSSWVCTLLTQVSLCFAVFLAFNIGGSKRPTYHTTTNMNRRGRPHDLYFLSVRGGSRSLKQQTHLLKQMEKVAKIYEVKFVVNISELGDDDPLTQNGTLYFPSLKVPWYTTNASRGQERRYFLKQIPLHQGKILDIIVVDTKSLRDYLHTEELSSTRSDQLHWLMRMLELTDSTWRIVIGFDPVVVCEEQEDSKETEVYGSLHHIFLKFGVNAYMSKQGCTNHYACHRGRIAYIGNLGPPDVEMPSNGSSIITREMNYGFFLHRVGLLDMVSYFINSENKLIVKSTLHQRGKDFM